MSVFRINKSPGEERSDKGLRDKLNAHSVTPPSYIWDNVEENLPQQRKRRPFILWLMPLAACIAGLAGLLYILLPENTSTIARKNVEKVNQTADLNKNAENKHENLQNPETYALTETEINTSNTEKDKNSTTQSNYNSKSSGIKGSNNAENTGKKYLSANHIKVKSTNKNNSALQSPDEKKTNKSGNENNTPVQQPTTDNQIIDSKDLQIAAVDSSIVKDSLTTENKALAENKASENNTGAKKTQIAKADKSKWSIGADLGVGSSYRFLSPVKGFQPDFSQDQGGTPQLQTSNPEDYNKVESAGFSWSAGLNAKYNINDKWSFITGLHYTRTSILSQINTVSYVTYDSPYEPRDTTYIQKNSTGEFNYIELDAMVLESGDPTNLGNNQDPQPVPTEATIRYSFNYIDIPLQLQYRTSAKKVAWFVQGGPSLKLLASKNAVYSAGSDYAVIKLGQAYNNFAISANLSSGISVPYKKFDFQVGPSFNVWLRPLMKTEPNTYLYTTHLKGSIYYNL